MNRRVRKRRVHQKGPVAREPPQQQQSEQQETKSLSEQTPAILAALASGIGVVGFATVVGGVVLWLRFVGGHVPASKAVAATPKEELLVLGAGTLLPYLGAAVVAVVAAWWFWSGSDRRYYVAPVILLLCEYLLLFLSGKPAPLVAVGALAIGMPLFFVNVKVIEKSRPRLTYAIALFVSVMLFGACMSALRTYLEPKLQPAAVLRKGFDMGTYGFYVAETVDRVYIARPDIASTGDRLLVLPRENVVGISVGQLRAVGQRNDRGRAIKQAQALLGELCRVKAPEPRAQAATGSANQQRGSRSVPATAAAPCPPKIEQRRRAPESP